ncbi:hypothetical protein CNMCM8980_000329 [Aspergillus fumigatiaffinis]|nr:hypothetical protein CNMCM8980_000329 [Aspergillus fumigatiaffinis]
MMGSDKDLHEIASQLSREPVQFTSGSHSPGSQPHRSSQMLQLRHRCQTGVIQCRETYIGSGKVIQGPPKALGLLQVLDPGSSTSPPIIVREKESPWDTFKPVFSCKLAGTVTIAVHKTRPSQLEAIRAYSPERADEVLRVFQVTRHENILSAKECYKDGDELFVLVDDLPLTLEHLASLHPDQHQVASVMFQILNGLHHLVEAGFEHTCLTSSNILLGSDGMVKIAALEHCVQCPPGQSQVPVINSLAVIMMQLMQSYEMDDGVIGVDDMERWPPYSEAFGFLEATSSARSIEALMKHPFVAKQHRPGELVGLARLAPIATKTFYSYRV